MYKRQVVTCQGRQACFRIFRDKSLSPKRKEKQSRRDPVIQAISSIQKSADWADQMIFSYHKTKVVHVNVNGTRRKACFNNKRLEKTQQRAQGQGRRFRWRCCYHVEMWQMLRVVVYVIRHSLASGTTRKQRTNWSNKTTSRVKLAASYSCILLMHRQCQSR